jgi:outer membrane lipoprotein-sorting protein
MNVQSTNDMESSDDLERRLQSLPLMLRKELDFTSGVLRRIEAENVRPESTRSVRIKTWLLRSAMGLAAGILVAVLVCMFVNSPRPALAMEEVEKHLLSLESVHVKGTIYPRGQSGGRPIEIFAQQPDHCLVNGYLNIGPTNISSFNVLVTPQQTVIFDPSAMTADVLPQTAEDARMQVSRELEAMKHIMFGDAPGFQRVRSEKLHGLDTDVYENSTDPHTRFELWVDPQTRLPVQSEMYETDALNPARLWLRLDTIETNPTIDRAVFDQTFGPGWKVTYPNALAVLGSAFNSVQFGNLLCSDRFLVSLGNGNLLLCWCLYDTTEPANDMGALDKLKSVTFSAPDGTKYTEHLLHADSTTTGFHWRWSLLNPGKQTADPAPAISMQCKDKRGDTAELVDYPVVYNPLDLAQRVQDLQKQTLPPGKSPMTLEQIESPMQSQNTGN